MLFCFRFWINHFLQNFSRFLIESQWFGITQRYTACSFLSVRKFKWKCEWNEHFQCVRAHHCWLSFNIFLVMFAQAFITLFDVFVAAIPASTMKMAIFTHTKRQFTPYDFIPTNFIQFNSFEDGMLQASRRSIIDINI